MAGQWQADIAAVDITPAEAVWMDGWAGRTQPAQGVQQRIFVKALALRDQAGRRAVLVGADILGFSQAMVLALRQWAQERHGLGPADLLLSASHNHSCALIEDLLPLYYDLPAEQAPVVQRYTRRLEAAVRQAIDEALAGLAPAELAWGQGLAGFAVNRRRARGEPTKTRPQVVDQDVPVLAVKGPAGKLRAVVFGYACHATTHDSGRIHGDYPGYAQEILEREHPGTTAIFVTGCGADANPLPRYRPELPETYGRILAWAVGDTLRGRMQPLLGELRTALATVRLPLEAAPDRAALEGLLATRPEGLPRREVRYQLDRLDQGLQPPTHLDCDVLAWRLGPLLLIGLTAESVADYALRFKAAYGAERTWVAGYCHQLLAYIPSRRVRLEGDYEGTDGMLEYRHPAPFTEAVEDVIAAAVDQLVGQIGAGESSV